MAKATQGKRESSKRAIKSEREVKPRVTRS